MKLPKAIQLSLCFYVLSASILITAKSRKNNSAVVTKQEREHGRLGHSLISLLNAYYISYKTKLPFFYAPLANFNLFSLSNLLPKVTDLNRETFSNEIYLRHRKELDINEENTLWVCNLQTNIGELENFAKLNRIAALALSDGTFEQNVRALLCPIGNPKFLSKSEVPRIAVHYRTGHGFDPPVTSPQLYDSEIRSAHRMYVFSDFKEKGGHMQTHPKRSSHSAADKQWPKKFPPLQYYLDELVLVCQLLPQAPMITITTDHKNPGEIKQKIATALEKNGLTYLSINCQKETLLKDLEALANAEILIRGDSAFAVIAQLMGRHAITIYPNDFRWVGNRLEITEAALMIKDETAKSLDITVDQICTHYSNAGGIHLEYISTKDNSTKNPSKRDIRSG